MISLLNPLISIWINFCRYIFIASFFISIAYLFGYIDRFIWYLLERAAKELWNGTDLTVGSLQYDIIRGRVWLTNVVVHNPKREEWKWKSPIIGRIGKVYVESNWVVAQSTALLRKIYYFLMYYGQRTVPPEPLELYTIQVSDIQGFIERKQHIFNFYLMDPCMQLPDPKDVIDTNSTTTNSSITLEEDTCITNELETIHTASSQQQNYTAATTATASAATTQTTDDDEKKAQELVEDIMLAVRTLGNAARTSGSGGVMGALAQHKESLKMKLQQIQANQNKTKAMQDSVRVMKHVSKAVARKTKEVDGILPLPKRRQSKPPPFTVRIGRVVIRNVRIFTRVTTNTSSSGSVKKSSSLTNLSNTHNNATNTTSTTTSSSTIADETKKVAAVVTDATAAAISDTIASDSNISASDSSATDMDDNNNNSNQIMDNNNNTSRSAVASSTSAAASDYNILSSSSNGTNSCNTSIVKDASSSTTKAENNNATSSASIADTWNKPIAIEEVIIRAGELCPPMSLLDENNLPAIYQDISKIMDVIWKRLIAEMAKQNTSQFLRMALGEVLELEYLNLSNGTPSENTFTNGMNNTSTDTSTATNMNSEF